MCFYSVYIFLLYDRPCFVFNERYHHIMSVMTSVPHDRYFFQFCSKFTRLCLNFYILTSAHYILSEDNLYNVSWNRLSQFRHGFFVILFFPTSFCALQPECVY